MVHGMEASIQRFIDAGFVTYSTWPGSKQQGRVYADCDRKYRHLWNWMLYMDADELLHVRDSSQSLKHVLNDYKLFPGIGVHWVQFGSGGHRQRPAEGGMMRHCALPHSTIATDQRRLADCTCITTSESQC